MEDTRIEIWKDDLSGETYELLDCGDGEKLEKVGEEIIRRPEPRALWQKSLNKESWDKASVIYKVSGQKGNWIFTDEKDKKEFDIEIGDIKTRIKIGGSSKHIGIFPEQYKQWLWISEKIKKEITDKKREINVLNLFGYTGIGTLFAAKSGLPREAGTKWGAKVTHVDASESSLEWARENQKISGLEELPIRWILDDALKFLKREIKRGAKYDCIIMDPPSFGRGPKGEVWKIEDNIKELMDSCKELLSSSPLFIILNMYSTDLSSLSLSNLLMDLTKEIGGKINSGELVLQQKDSSKILPLSIFSIWESKN